MNSEQTTENQESSADSEVVILLQGDNVFGDKIFSYLQLTVESLHKLKAKLDSKENFTPSDFGTVLNAGLGDPDDELRQEMGDKYKLVDIEQPIIDKSQPSFWGGSDVDSVEFPEEIDMDKLERLTKNQGGFSAKIAKKNNKPENDAGGDAGDN